MMIVAHRKNIIAGKSISKAWMLLIYTASLYFKILFNIVNDLICLFCYCQTTSSANIFIIGK